MDLVANTSSSAAARMCCTMLEPVLPNRVILQNDSLYQVERDAPWSQTCWLPATCFVRPTSSQDVAETLKAVKETGSKFAIRCGGHNPNPGFSSSDDSGIVIDLHELNTLHLGQDGILQVGAGNKWGAVYNFIEEHELTIIGGRHKDVGVAGYLLGGGMPAFPGLYGLGADQIKNVEIVLSDATVVNANEESNSDLLQVLKGGGSNFGIVTRFDIQTYPQVKTQYTVNIYDPADYVNIMRAVTELQEAMEADPKIGTFTNVNPTFIAVGLFYAEWVEKRPQAFDTFFNLKSLISAAVPTTNGTMRDLVLAIGTDFPVARRQYASQASKVDTDFYVDVYEHYQQVVKKYPAAGNLSYTIQPTSTATIDAGEERGGNILGLEKVPQCWWAFVAEWEGQQNDTVAQEAIDELYQGMQKLSHEKGQWLDFIFMNEGMWTQNVLGSYGATSVSKMEEMRAKYDPDGMFQRLQQDGYLLSRTV
ncbi:6-hydroxy-D-nicotine oxidase [Biscogniauxia sp. FL1348]|nr:6-hydroxy-D-nicotine oxidase [Biscogniauxia sp. FL1348]